MFPKSFGPKHMLFSIYFLSNFQHPDVKKIQAPKRSTSFLHKSNLGMLSFCWTEATEPFLDFLVQTKIIEEYHNRCVQYQYLAGSDHISHQTGTGKSSTPKVLKTGMGYGFVSKRVFLSLRIHVWYIYLHLVDLYGKCR